MSLVIIGGGIAGTTAADTARQISPDESITIIERSAEPLYSRVLLPHYVKGSIPREKVFLKPPSWYQEKNLELILETEVLKIDAKNQSLLLSDGRELPYDQLIIASGTTPRLLSGDADGVLYLYSLGDADNIIAKLNLAQASGLNTAAVYGGGFIGCEFINIFFHRQLNTSVFLRGTGFFGNSLGPSAQRILADQAISKGLKLFFNQPEPELLTAKGLLTGLRLADGSVYETSLLGVGIGTEVDHPPIADSPEVASIPPQLNLAKLEPVGEDLSLTENIWVAGDLANAFDPIVDRPIRYGNWQNALSQGKAAGLSALSQPLPKRPISQYSTNLLGLPIVFLGDTSRLAGSEIIQKSLTSTGSEEWFIRSGRLVGVALVGDVSSRLEKMKILGTMVT